MNSDRTHTEVDDLCELVSVADDSYAPNDLHGILNPLRRQPALFAMPPNRTFAAAMASRRVQCEQLLLFLQLTG